MTFKRFIAAAATATMIAAMCAGSAFADDVRYGDVNKSGAVDINDVTYIQQVLVDAKTPADMDEYVKIGDVNGDKEVTIRDATFIQRYIAGLEKYFPVDWDPRIIQP